jgi:hypothetical protein
MDKAKIAEWILSLAMEPAQAGSVVGDLLEAGATRNVAWFWSNVFQTLAVRVWRDVKTEPRFVAGLAIRGALVQAAFSFFGLMICMIVCVPLVLIGRFIFLTFYMDHLPWHHHNVALIFSVLLIMVSMVIGPSYYVGRWIARRSLGKDIAVCLSMIVISRFTGYGIRTLMNGFLSLYRHQAFVWPLFWQWGWAIIICSFAAWLVGVTRVRGRRQVPEAAVC